MYRALVHFPQGNTPVFQFHFVNKILWFRFWVLIIKNVHLTFWNRVKLVKLVKMGQRPISGPLGDLRDTREVPVASIASRLRWLLTIVDRQPSRHAQGSSLACRVSPISLSADSFLPTMGFTQKFVPFKIPTRFIHYFKAINYYYLYKSLPDVNSSVYPLIPRV
jgi:hypothetical protein